MGSITLMVPKKQYSRAKRHARACGDSLEHFCASGCSRFVSVYRSEDIFWLIWQPLGWRSFRWHCPHPTTCGNGSRERGRGKFIQDILYGFKFIMARPSLRGLQSIWMSANLLATTGNVLIAALILARTGGDKFVLSGVEAILSAGAVVGGLVISTWGGPKKKIRGALISMALCAVFGRVLFGLGRDFITWIPGSIFSFFYIPILNGCLAPVWLSKVRRMCKAG